MGKTESHSYLKATQSCYLRIGIKSKATIVDEFCAVCGYCRKHAIQLLSQQGRPTRKWRPGRKPIYVTPKSLTTYWLCISPAHDPATRMTTPIWNRKTWSHVHQYFGYDRFKDRLGE